MPSGLTARVLMVVALVAVSVALAGLLIVLILRGGVTANAPSVVALLSYLGIVIGLLANLAGVQSVSSSVQQVAATQQDLQRKINGHLQSHVDAAVAAAKQESESGQQ